ncbi:hypothetical protein TrRE_jg695, partial [Triparma retinervis]
MAEKGTNDIESPQVEDYMEDGDGSKSPGDIASLRGEDERNSPRVEQLEQADGIVEVSEEENDAEEGSEEEITSVDVDR